MKNHIYDTVTLFSSENVGTVMNRLVDKGWKNVRFRNGGDFNPDFIEGERPMEKDEIEERVRIIEQSSKDEVKKLRKLAKKHGFKLVKE